MVSKVTRMGVLENKKVDRPRGKLVMWRRRMWLAGGRTMQG